MRKFGRIVFFSLFWAAVAVILIMIAHRSHRLASERTVSGIEIEIADSSRIDFTDVGTIKRWISAAGINPVGRPVDEASLRDIERVILSHGFIRTAEAYTTLSGVIRVEVTQHRPIMRMCLAGGYDFYVTDRDEIFRSPELSAVYVPVVTGGFSVPFAADFEGPSRETLDRRLDELETRIDSIEEQQNVIRIELRAISKMRSEIRSRQIDRKFTESKEDFAVRVERLKQHKRDSLALYNYRRTVREQRIEAKDREIERVRESQKKLQKNYSDFINLINFVKLIDDDDFWRAQIVEIIVSQSQNGELELRLIPRAGRHTIIFGRIEDVERKLDKLRRFYRIGLDREGWDRYRTIDIRFKGQVVCSPAAR